MLFEQHFQSAQDFIWKNARIIDRRLFDTLFCNAAGLPVTAALKAYQNSDGGFGNGLEADKRCPDSLPVDVQVAFEYLDRAGIMLEPAIIRELVLPACEFLETITTPEGGVPRSLPVAKKYPHAAWWEADDNPPAALNPTAAIVGLLLKHKIQHPWIERAVVYCRMAVEASDTEMYHDLMPSLEYLMHSPEREFAEKELDRIAARLRKPRVIDMDPSATGYAKMPLDWAPTPAHFCRRLFSDETLQTHLAALAGRQQADGGWPISWEALSPGVITEWRGLITINALETLKTYQEAGFQMNE